MMRAERMKELVEANARGARQLLGEPTLPTPSEADAGLALRSRVLRRSLYPSAAPPPAAGVAPAEPAPSDTVTTQTALITAPAPTMTATPGMGASSSPLGTSSSASSSLLVVKRGRDGEQVGYSAAGGDRPLLSVNPAELRDRHALVVAAAGRQAVEGASDYVPPASWKLSKVLVGHQGWVWAAAVDPTNAWFATGGGDTVIKVWDLVSGALKMNMTGHKEAVRSIALSAISPYMFSGSDDHSVKCWDLERNEVVREFYGHRSAVHAVSVHPTLDVVFSGGRDKTVRVWDVRTRACVHTLEGHTDSVMCTIAQQAEPQVMSGGSDGMIYLWDVGSGRAITRLTRHTKPVRGLALTASGTQLVSCGADEVRIWSMPTGSFDCNASTIVDKGTGAGAKDGEELSYRWSCCAISPRNVLTVGSQDGHIGVYDMSRPQSRSARTPYYCPYQLTRTKSIPGTLAGEGGINCVVYDASGTRMITAESDKSVKIWRPRDR